MSHQKLTAAAAAVAEEDDDDDNDGEVTPISEKDEDNDDDGGFASVSEEDDNEDDDGGFTPVYSSPRIRSKEATAAEKCRCKRGRCRDCGSACRRCGCACDGVDPSLARVRKPGKRGPSKASTEKRRRYEECLSRGEEWREDEPPTPKRPRRRKKWGDEGATEEEKKRTKRSQDEMWRKKYEALRAYKEEHGDFALPTPGTKEERTLKDWVRKQKSLLKVLRQEEENQDGDIDGKAKKPISGRDRPKRRKEERLSVLRERIRLLEEIGFAWGVRQYGKRDEDAAAAASADDHDAGTPPTTLHQRKWLAMFEKLRHYGEEHGHFRIRARYNGGNVELRTWVNRHRRQRAEGDPRLTDEKIRMLDSIGFNWEYDYREDVEAEWTEKYQELCAYKERHGDCMVPYLEGQPEHEHFSLSRWVRQMRSYHASRQKAKQAATDGTGPQCKASLGDEHIRLLNEIGFEWQPGQAPRCERRWMAKYNDLVQYWAEHGHSNVPRDHPDKKLVGWTKMMRNRYNHYEKGDRTTLTPERVQLLRDVGFDFNPAPHRKRRTWEDRFEQLVEFHEDHGHCDVPCKYSRVLLLPRWVKEQRKELRALFEGRQSKLTWDRYVKLDRLGFRFVANPMEEEKCATPWTFCTCNMDADADTDTKVAGDLGDDDGGDES